MGAAIKPLVAGNWKMNGLKAAVSELQALVDGYDADLAAKVDSMICPPATLIAQFADVTGNSAVAIGAQDCHVNVSGAHTGDLSAQMVADAGAVAIIVGHSERRADHGEGNEVVKAKAEAVWAQDLVAIICVGETEVERKSGETLDVIKAQLAGSVPAGATAANCVIAYEPVWAIGTGLTPTAQDVSDVHACMRDELSKAFGDEGATMRLLYGGSVKPSNASELMSVANVDGALVGGASLKAADFLGIMAAYK
ncbi:MAG: triose-phosphate isomerase [Cohaesibacter sp.]|nr:triose-phosphate isomerase [Cohaesibacter sp.]MCV6600557.1 triose-phosphate isomerase [Cohaesibacter sp.]